MLYFVSNLNENKFYSVEYDEDNFDRDFYEGFRRLEYDYTTTHYLDSNCNLCDRSSAVYTMRAEFDTRKFTINIYCNELDKYTNKIAVAAKAIALEADEDTNPNPMWGNSNKQEIVYSFGIFGNAKQFLKFAFEFVAYFNFKGGFASLH